ncbi:DUF4345 family protein [Tautonia rosea]|uniref:DUF4345 family protein n=1 Tax=Tautonia rosea TaxID=2728037 RepID=UPI00147656B6|nr:DUF4345 family protein [Tautonia rosea]
MRLARISLWLTAIAFGGFGLWLLIQPEGITGLGVELTHPVARAEIRAFYGGLELGLALFFTVAASRPSWFAAGLFAQAAALGGVALGRIIGIVVDGVSDSLFVGLLAAELTGCLIGIVALWLLDRKP